MRLLSVFISIWTLSSAALVCPPAFPFPTQVSCLVDRLADDVPGQKDINQFCVRDTGADFFTLFWTFDDYSTSTDYTSCALFDDNTDGLIDKAICVLVGASTKSSNPPPVYKSLTYYTCGNQYPDRCYNPTVVRNPATSVCCTVSVQSVDPFATHTGLDKQDTVVQCNLVQDLRGTLLNVCSFPSGPGSSTGDCVRFSGTCSVDADCGAALPCQDIHCAVPSGQSNKVCIQAAQPTGTSCGGSGDCGSMTCNLGACIQNFLPSTTVCRPKAQGKEACDVAEQCTGNSFACPDDAIQPVGTLCGAAATACSNADTCDSNAVCQPNDKLPGAVCGSGNVGVSSCSDPDTCDGFGVCANTNNKADGTSCGTSDLCVQQQCFSGVCQYAHAGQAYVSQSAAQTAADAHCNQGRNCYSYTCVGGHTVGGTPSPCVPGALKAGNSCPTVTDSTCQKLCCNEDNGQCTVANLCGGFPASPGRRILEILAASSPNPKATALPN